MALKPATNAGFTTGVRFWIFFLICFALLGYSPFLSICLGAVGGIAAGVLDAWVKAKDDGTEKEPEKQPEDPAIVTEPQGKTRPRRPAGFLSQRRRHKSQGQRRFGSLFRRN